MKKIEIFNTINGKKYKAQFETQEQADVWLAKHIAKNTFGPGERLVPVSECSEEELASALEILAPVMSEDGQELSPAQARLPKTYEVVIEDISAQIEQERVNAEALEFLKATDFKILRHLRQKALGEQLSLSEQEYLALEQERSAAAARIAR